MTQVSDMKSVQVLCKPDRTGEVIYYVANGLGDDVQEYIESLPIGIYRGNTLIGGVLFTSIRPQRDCWLTIYTTTPYWAKRHVLRYIFNIVFNLIKAERCSVLVSKSNQKSFDMCKRLGFVEEGYLRQYRPNGDDCYVMGMLKKECKWYE